MSLLLLMAAASAAPVAYQPPRPSKPVISPSDYPDSVVRSGEQGAVLFQAFVDPAGKVMDCKVELIVGSDFGDLVCDKVRSAGLMPAKDSAGQPTYGAIRTLATLWLPESDGPTRSPFTMAPDLALLVKPIPGLITRPRDLKMVVVVDGKGRISACGTAEKRADTRLVTPACAQLRAQWSGDALQDPAGTTRDHVRELTVAFLPDEAAN